MTASLEVIVGILVVVLLAFTSVALWVGLAALFGERLGRCPRCGRRALTVGGCLHAAGCPPSFYEHIEHLGHVMRAWADEVHLRHH